MSAGAAAARRWLWTLLALGLVVASAAAAILLSRGGGEEPRWRLYHQGVDAFERGTYGLASEIFTQYLDRHGEYAPARYMLGVSLFRMGNRERAVENVLEAARSDPDLDEATLFLAERAWEAGRLPETLRFARTALANPPRPADAHLFAGMVLGHPAHEDVSAAIRHLTAAERGGAGFLSSRLLLLELLAKMRRALPGRVDDELFEGLVREVAAELESRTANRTGSTADYLMLARLHLVTGSPDPARMALSRARQLDAEVPEYWYLQARADWLGGHRDSAVLQIRHLLKLDAPAVLLYELADFLGDRGEVDLAGEVVARGAVLYGEEASFRLWRLRWLLGVGRIEEATALAETIRPDLGGTGEFDLVDARVMERAGERERAMALLREMIGDDRAAAAARLRLARLILSGDDERSRRVAAARELLAAAEEEEGTAETARLFLSGWIALLEGRLDDAEDRLSRSVTRDPTRADAHLVLAETLLRMEEPGRATDEVSAAIRLLGARTDLLLMRARARLAAATEELEPARTDLLAVLEREPTDPEALGLLADVVVRSGREAEPADWERVVEGAGRDDAPAGLLATVGRAALARGDAELAARLAGRAVERAAEPGDRWDALELRARALKAGGTGDPELTTGEILRAAAARESAPAGKLRYGWIMLEGGHPDAARVQAESVLEDDPDDPEAHRLRFEAAFAEPSPEEALAAARAVARELADAAPDGPDDLYARGKLALAEGDPARARGLLERALALAPDDHYAACFLGRACFERGDLDEAAARLRRALRLRPDFRTARRYLAEVNLEVGRRALDGGNPSAAAKAFLDADELAPGDGRGALAFARTVLDHEFTESRFHRREARERLARVIGKLFPDLPSLGEAETELLARCLLAETDLALMERDFRGAAEAMSAYLEIHPEDRGARLYRTVSLLFSGDPETAVTELTAMAGAAPEDWVPTALLGEALLRAGRPGEAGAVFADWLERHPADPGAALGLSIALGREGRDGDAARVLLDTLSERPDAVDCAIRLAEMAENGGDVDPESVRRALRAALPATSHPAELRFLLERLDREAGAGGQGVAALTQALGEGFTHLPLEVDCRAMILKDLIEAGKGGEAVRHARAFIAEVQPRLGEGHVRIRPGSLAEAWEMVGVALYGAGDLETAEVSFRRALNLAPDWPLAANNLAYLILDRPAADDPARRAMALEEAERLAQKAVDGEPDNPEFHDTLGAVALARGEYAVAAESYATAAGLGGDAAAPAARARALLGLAEALARGGEKAKARTALAGAAEVDPAVTTSDAYERVAGLLGE